MRKKSIITTAVLITASLFFAACDGDKTRDPHISFTFDGEEYSWTKGIEGSISGEDTTIVFDGSVSGSLLPSQNNDNILMTMASPLPFVVSTDTKTDFDQDAIMLTLSDITGPGMYTYTSDSSNSQVMILLNEVNYSLTGNGVDSLEIDITDIDEIGGYISGSFSATVTDLEDDESQHTITNGKFRIKQIDDLAYYALFFFLNS